MHHGGVSAHCTLGARGGTGGDAGPVGEDAGGGTHPPANCGACVRYAEILDGIHALPDEAIAQRTNRDEFARAGLQLEASDADLRGRTADAGDQGVTALFLPRHQNTTTLSGRVDPQATKSWVSTQPRSRAGSTFRSVSRRPKTSRTPLLTGHRIAAIRGMS